MENAEDKRSKEIYGQPEIPAALSVTELLAPAGEPDALYGAFAAGADAVYLGAARFSARAYAKNFTTQELTAALDHAHIFGKKIYLACNTLMRNSEFDELFELMDPLYEHALDGAIVQDIGLLSLLKIRYPLLPLHGSTQMSVNSVSGALWLKEQGVCRLVPGRELSIKEIRQIKQAGIELECFVHGAMCYSYSGKCLLSSMAGGRSGNRGRCAGPCRQPYYYNKKDKAYYLSMKDMMALNSLPELIEAGVDSFKIEGRMKAPEYAAGVSAIYRKYIDLYLSGKAYKIDKADLKALEELYMRSERQEGYLHKHNGADMISLDNPAYSKVSEERKAAIRAAYIEKPLKKPVSAQISVKAGEDTTLTLSCDDKSICISGDRADKAQKRPLSDGDIRKQLLKTGDTDFEVKEIDIVNDGASFMPVSALNALRRDAFDKLYDKLLEKRTVADKRIEHKETQVNSKAPDIIVGLSGSPSFGELAEREYISGFITEIFPFLDDPERYLRAAGAKKLYLRLPDVIRQEKLPVIKEWFKEAVKYDVTGFYCSSLDALMLAGQEAGDKEIKADAGLYVFNPFAEEEILKHAGSYTISHEFSAADISGAIRRDAAELIVYGRIPIMYSANCAVKTDGACDMKAGWQILSDEKGHDFPLRPVHELCYNILYNCVPLSLHREVYGLYKDKGFSALRIEFTDESEAVRIKIADAFNDLICGRKTDFPLREGASSRGHYKRGAE